MPAHRHMITGFACLAIFASSGLAQDRAPDQRRGDRPAIGQINPQNDEVLAHIRAAVDLSEEQFEKILALYTQLRQDQRDEMRQFMQSRRSGQGRPERGQRPQGGGNRQRPQRDDNAQPGQRRQGGGQGFDREQMMKDLNEKLVPMNEAFLADSRKLLTKEQRESWDLCAEAIDLTPQFGRGGRGQGPGQNQGPKVGENAPAFELTNLEGETVTLKSLLGQPIVIEFGSYTCPVFRRKVDQIASLKAEFGEDEVKWVMIYTKEAHPTDGWALDMNARAGIELAQHKTDAQRLECATLAAKELELDLLILVDDIGNKVADAYAGHPNRGFVLDAKGKIVSRQAWIEIEPTRKALENLLKEAIKPSA